MKRPDIRLHLMLVFGLGNQHTGNKGSQGQTQARQFRQPGQAQGDEQKVQDKQLFTLASRHQREPPSHHVLATDHQHGNQYGGLQRSEGQSLEQLLA